MVEELHVKAFLSSNQYLLRVYNAEVFSFNITNLSLSLSPLLQIKEISSLWDINNAFLNSRAYRQAFLCMHFIAFFEEYKDLEENDFKKI